MGGQRSAAAAADHGHLASHVDPVERHFAALRADDGRELGTGWLADHYCYFSWLVCVCVGNDWRIIIAILVGECVCVGNDWRIIIAFLYCFFYLFSWLVCLCMGNP